MLIIKTSDFKNFFELAQTNITTPILQDYIDRYEEPTLRELLGKALGNLFIADITNGAPQTQRFIDIFNEIIEDQFNPGRSKGIKHILICTIYYHFVMERIAYHSQSGVAKNQVEAAKVLDSENANRFAEIRWDDSLESWKVIQIHVRREASTYPEYKNSTERFPKYSPLL